MCRLFGQISLKEESAEDFLLHSKFSLLTQSDCKKKSLQKDGWGIGEWRTENGAWRIAKSFKPVFKEKNKFKKIAESANSKIVLAHIRHASNPKKLPQEKLVALENSQPFSYRDIIFAHNGTLNIPDELSETLGIYQRKIRGTNDSEVLFWLCVKLWRRYSFVKNIQKRWQTIFRQMLQNIQAVWRQIPKNKRKFSSPLLGLNCIVSDGLSLAALCYYEKAEGKSLCGKHHPYFQMCYNVSTGRIAIASEPMDESRNWKPIPKKHLLWIGSDCELKVCSI